MVGTAALTEVSLKNPLTLNTASDQLHVSEVNTAGNLGYSPSTPHKGGLMLRTPPLFGRRFRVHVAPAMKAQLSEERQRQRARRAWCTQKMMQ